MAYLKQFEGVNWWKINGLFTNVKQPIMGYFYKPLMYR